jgi:hypothetical protein
MKQQIVRFSVLLLSVGLLTVGLLLPDLLCLLIGMGGIGWYLGVQENCERR